MRRYTFKDNLISFLIGVVLAIPICACAWRAWNPETDTREEINVETINSLYEAPTSSQRDIFPTAGVAQILESAEEKWIDGGYPDRVPLGEFKVTAYCPCEICCPGTADGITYTETIATEGRTLSVDPDVIPLGSIVEIDGVNYIAEDIGGGIKENHVEIYFDNHEDALEWGVQYLEVYMVEEGLDYGNK